MNNPTKIQCSIEIQQRILAFRREMQTLLSNRIDDIAFDAITMPVDENDADMDIAFDRAEDMRNYLWNAIRDIAECPYNPI